MAHDIRRLAPHDLATMRELNALFACVFEDSASYASAPPDDNYLSRLLGKDSVFALAALRDGSVIGGLVAYELKKFEQARSEIYIYDLAVSAPHRRQGVARALIENLQNLAATRGTWVIYVQADYGDEPAIALYTALGQREEILHFDIPVPPR
ncbi:aminoglycoside 3-N-acetyltransferase I [Devosia crocina]|uniref:Aminoglycoside 3-N-acetyltransferase I n=1 Tax=Devosia crocina TaxID=429728 RepID=A0A1I7NNB5_9HYPH|nr:AAC(3)-I family aminoglycoside N-acetyltransferase [Devosia crocina]SFV36158.1 aminoglycoside 3-N-acetyltransferase I [Devosia crocina]